VPFVEVAPMSVFISESKIIVPPTGAEDCFKTNQYVAPFDIVYEIPTDKLLYEVVIEPYRK
jgi:hypothetical protein